MWYQGFTGYFSNTAYNSEFSVNRHDDRFASNSHYFLFLTLSFFYCTINQRELHKFRSDLWLILTDFSVCCIRKSLIYSACGRLEPAALNIVPLETRLRPGHVRITRTTSRNAVHASWDSSLNNRPPSLRTERYRSGLGPEDLSR